MERSDIYVVGMRMEKFIGVEADSSTSYDTKPCNDEKCILFCIVKTPYGISKKCTITLSSKGGWCGSGYTTSTWGDMDIEEVDEFGPATHKPKDNLPIKMENAYYDNDINNICFEKKTEVSEDEYRYWDSDVYNNVFKYSRIGGDAYYPCGWVDVNMDLFIECKERSFEERPVWIFSGESGTGKSTLAYYLSKDKEVFETDSLKDDKLPETIWADIIVVGNKYKFGIPDIAEHIPKGTEIITVDFMKGYFNE